MCGVGVGANAGAEAEAGVGAGADVDADAEGCGITGPGVAIIGDGRTGGVDASDVVLPDAEDDDPVPLTPLLFRPLMLRGRPLG